MYDFCFDLLVLFLLFVLCVCCVFCLLRGRVRLCVSQLLYCCCFVCFVDFRVAVLRCLCAVFGLFVVVSFWCCFFVILSCVFFFIIAVYSAYLVYIV